MLYYFRGILNLFKQQLENALDDFNKALKYSESIVSKYYLGRARCYACISMFKEAINDLNIALEENNTLIDAYILRGKCAFIDGDTNQAFSDFQTIVKLRPEDPLMHIHAGNILMVSGAYEQAIKAYSNGHKLGVDNNALFGRVRCYVAMCQIPEALADIKKINKQEPTMFKNDLEILKIINFICMECLNFSKKQSN